MDSSLRSDKHIDNITKKAATISRMILFSFTAKNQDILKRAFCTYVRPILEYCSPIRNPHKKYLIDRIKRIQRRFTKAISSVASHPYMEKLRLLNLPTLEKRRLWVDLSLCFKLRRGLLNCTASFSLIPSTYSRTRGHNFKLRTGKIRCEATKNFFCNHGIPCLPLL